MSQHPRILIQLDSDLHPSVFDSVVAIDSAVDHLLQYGAVKPSNVRGLVHGAMFTRGPDVLKNTAIFIGGSDAAVGGAIAEAVRATFFGPVSVSVMLDGNGSNTTAAAAVLCARRHMDLSTANALVLGGTGPVGQRVARLLLGQGATVAISSRDKMRAEKSGEELLEHVPESFRGNLSALGIEDEASLDAALQGRSLLVCCGAAGVRLVKAESLAKASDLRVVVDLNAVAPEGVEGVSVMDKAVCRGARTDYGAIGTGGLKMKIHREAIQTLFTRNDLFLDAEQIYEIGLNLEKVREV